MVKRTTEFYNLDVIISVGYRVKSKNGVAFRKWASSLLIEYLLRGYVVDSGSALVTNENYINPINKVESIDARLARIEEEHNPDLKKVFFGGSNPIILGGLVISSCSSFRRSACRR